MTNGAKNGGAGLEKYTLPTSSEFRNNYDEIFRKKSGKTAVVILNHNLPEFTDRLVELLSPYSGDEYDVIVLDNGSSRDGKSQYTKYEIEKNCYYGGGFEVARQLVLNNPDYDSLLFMNNDLVLSGYNFVHKLRKSLDKYGVVSPCFFNIEPDGQCHWKTMHNWAYGVRNVPFVDMQCPLIRRDVLELMGTTDTDLLMGWGIDAYMAIVCQQNRIAMAVDDTVSMLHYNSLTVKSGVAGLSMEDYCSRAEEGQRNFFTKRKLIDAFINIRDLAGSYYPAKADLWAAHNC